MKRSSVLFCNLLNTGKPLLHGLKYLRMSPGLHFRFFLHAGISLVCLFLLSHLIQCWQYSPATVLRHPSSHTPRASIPPPPPHSGHTPHPPPFSQGPRSSCIIPSPPHISSLKSFQFCCLAAEISIINVLHACVSEEVYYCLIIIPLLLSTWKPQP